MGVPVSGSYKEILSSDEARFGVSGFHNRAARSKKGEMHGFDQHITLTLPPLSTLYFQVPQPKPVAKKPAAKTTKKSAAKKPAAEKKAKSGAAALKKKAASPSKKKA